MCRLVVGPYADRFSKSLDGAFKGRISDEICCRPVGEGLPMGSNLHYLYFKALPDFFNLLQQLFISFQYLHESAARLRDCRFLCAEHLADLLESCSAVFVAKIDSRVFGYPASTKDNLAEFKERKLFVGSGVMDAGCRTVVGQRLKQSGMHWTVRGANNIIALRCSLLSNRWRTSGNAGRRREKGAHRYVSHPSESSSLPSPSQPVKVKTYIIFTTLQSGYSEIMLQKLKPHLIPALLLLLMTITVYGQTLGHDFLSNWDDNAYITQNMAVKGVSLEHLKMAFSSLYVGNYAPVQIVSYMLDFNLWGMRASGFHLTNLFLHITNGMLLYLLVFRICGRRAWAFPAAAVFLLHPVQVESVAWLSQRKNLLAMCFFLFSLLSYHIHQQRIPGCTARYYVLSIVCFCIALLSKSVAVILPFVLLLLDLCCESSPRRKGLWLDKLPFLSAAAAMAGLTVIFQSPEIGGGRADFQAGSPLATFFTMQTVLVRYLWMLLWPLNLSPLYLPQIKPHIDIEVALALLFVAALTVAGIILLRSNRRLFFGYALFFIGLLPVSQIVPLVTLMNDRYLYFPLLGGSWLIGGLICHIVDMTTSWQRRIAISTCAVLMAGFALVSFQRAAVWKNSVTLWNDAVPKLPDSFVVRAALAEAQLNAGMRTEALRTYSDVISLLSDAVDPILERKALNNSAALYMDNGQLDVALPLLRRLVARYPNYPPGFINLGNSQFMARNLSAAEQAYRTALILEPGNTMALMMLGNIYLDTGRIDSTRELYFQALANGGNGPDLQYNLACLEAKTGHNSAALQHLGEALQLGYRNFDLISHNPILAPIRQLPTYRQLQQSHFPSTSR